MIALLAVFPALLYANVAEKQSQLSEIQSRIQQVNTDLKTLNAEKSAQLDELKKVEKQFGELANALRAIKSDIRRQEEKLQEIRNKIAATQKELQNQKLALEGLIKSAYSIGGQEGLKLILNQRDPSLSGRMLIYHDYISKARVQKLQLLQEKSSSLKQLEAQKDAETGLLQIALEKKQSETDNLQLLKNQREKLLVALNNEYMSKNQQMERLRHDEKKLAAVVASLQKTDDNAEPEPRPISEAPKKQEPASQIEPEAPAKTPKPEKFHAPAKAFVDLQGALAWPVAGEVAERFGSRRFETVWDGTVINAHEGADVHAVAVGRVVYADWLRGYGLMIIVDHGGGYMSLYGFNQSLQKSVGEQVASGDTLASVGRSGGRSQAALYFGIRKKGKPVNPELWCRTSGKN